MLSLSLTVLNAGDHFWERMQMGTPTFSLYCLWDLDIITSDANIIKVYAFVLGYLRL